MDEAGNNAASLSQGEMEALNKHGVFFKRRILKAISCSAHATHTRLEADRDSILQSVTLGRSHHALSQLGEIRFPHLSLEQDLPVTLV